MVESSIRHIDHLTKIFRDKYIFNTSSYTGLVDGDRPIGIDRLRASILQKKLSL